MRDITMSFGSVCCWCLHQSVRLLGIYSLSAVVVPFKTIEVVKFIYIKVMLATKGIEPPAPNDAE